MWKELAILLAVVVGLVALAKMAKAGPDDDRRAAASGILAGGIGR